LRQIAVAAPRLREQHQTRMRRVAVRQRQADLAADDQMKPELFRFEVRAHDASKRAFVGDRERAVAQIDRSLVQLFRMRRAAEKTEVAAAMQLGVGRERQRYHDDDNNNTAELTRPEASPRSEPGAWRRATANRRHSLRQAGPHPMRERSAETMRR